MGNLLKEVLGNPLSWRDEEIQEYSQKRIKELSPVYMAASLITKDSRNYNPLCMGDVAGRATYLNDVLKILDDSEDGERLIKLAQENKVAVILELEQKALNYYFS